ncbi:hypothetical protein TAMA11512_08260 [Selenomonas sp. TAMA-11512]|uniref:FHA domain-containing protein n=1 Tax=Selenomonas sp. TAMA-11512 TaxID=3095337 RepID=UPI00308810A8|nr:hypothetical protein TAMA11512_08260 [Selenomonas sp. TAMA-11512]
MTETGAVMQILSVILQYGALLALLLFVLRLSRAMFFDMRKTCRELKPEPQVRKEAVLEILEAPDASMAGRRFAFTGALTIGRGPENSIVFQDAYISHHHVRIVLYQNRFCVEDAGGKNPTFVNDKQLPPKGRIFLKSGDIIKLGLAVLRFER